jgi:hypothetical protein
LKRALLLFLVAVSYCAQNTRGNNPTPETVAYRAPRISPQAKLAGINSLTAFACRTPADDQWERVASVRVPKGESFLQQYDSG